MALDVSGQAVELREVALKSKPVELLQASPKGTVPVLIDTDGTVFDESLNIMLWALSRHDPDGWLVPQVGTLDEMRALIGVNDTDFKAQLDRYKYPERYAVTDRCEHRQRGASFLLRLEGMLNQHAFLFGSRPALADIAIFPFVRQYSRTDVAWFLAQPWPRLCRWLDFLVDSHRFARIMAKPRD